MDVARLARIGQGLPVVAEPAGPQAVSLPNALTLSGYALGVWWSLGGPWWSAVASIAFDELDGRLARSEGQASDLGGALDWGADVALTPLALVRLGQEIDRPWLPLAAAPPALALQAYLRAKGERSSVLSLRALIMLSALAVQAAKRVK